MIVRETEKEDETKRKIDMERQKNRKILKRADRAKKNKKKTKKKQTITDRKGARRIDLEKKTDRQTDRPTNKQKIRLTLDFYHPVGFHRTGALRFVQQLSRLLEKQHQRRFGERWT